MPNFPKPQKRPWLPERKPQTGRKITSKFYHSPAWRKVRKLYITEHPLCEICLKKGKPTTATVVDHIKQINPANAFDTQNGRFGEPLSYHNLQSLCTHCHAIKSGKERHKNI